MISLTGPENYLDEATVIKFWRVMLDNSGQYTQSYLHLFPNFDQVPYVSSRQPYPRRLRLSFEKPTDAMRDTLSSLAENGMGTFSEFNGFHSMGGSDTMKLIPVDNLYVPSAEQVAEVWRFNDRQLGEDSMWGEYPREEERAISLMSKPGLHVSPPGLGNEPVCDVCGTVIEEEDWIIEQFELLWDDDHGWPDVLSVKTPCGHDSTLNRIKNKGKFVPYGVSKFLIINYGSFEAETLGEFERILQTPLRQMCHQL